MSLRVSCGEKGAGSNQKPDAHEQTAGCKVSTSVLGLLGLRGRERTAEPGHIDSSEGESFQKRSDTQLESYSMGEKVCQHQTVRVTPQLQNQRCLDAKFVVWIDKYSK